MDADDVVRIHHHENGTLVNLPLFDDDEKPLFPELMERLDAMSRKPLSCEVDPSPQAMCIYLGGMIIFIIE